VSASTVSAVLERQLEGAAHRGGDRAARSALRDKQMYSFNRQASGSAQSQSGLTAMIIPLHDNRFFQRHGAGVRTLARERNWHPLV
jgi:DNA-binding LacI/PurR family transcriptional regulator